MRKYILTDRNGATATGQALQPGKLLQTEIDKSSMMANLDGCGGDTPLLAALISPIPTAQARLFNINCWRVAANPKQPQSYTVIKEVNVVPPVTARQRLRFAVLLARESCADRDFQCWAEDWLNGIHPSVAQVELLIQSIDTEMRATAELDAIASWGNSGYNQNLANHRVKGMRRALHALRAAHLSEQPDREASAAMEIALALTDLDQVKSGVNPQVLAETACATETAEVCASG